MFEKAAQYIPVSKSVQEYLGMDDATFSMFEPELMDWLDAKAVEWEPDIQAGIQTKEVVWDEESEEDMKVAMRVHEIKQRCDEFRARLQDWGARAFDTALYKLFSKL